MRGLFVYMDVTHGGELGDWYFIGPEGAAQAVEATERLESFYALLGALGPLPKLIEDGAEVRCGLLEAGEFLMSWLEEWAPGASLFYPAGGAVEEGLDEYELNAKSRVYLAELPPTGMTGGLFPVGLRVQMSPLFGVRLCGWPGLSDDSEAVALSQCMTPAEWLGALRWAAGVGR